MPRHSGQHIENPEAYHRAIQKRIKANANITRSRKFQAAEPEVFAWLTHVWSLNGYNDNPHPAGHVPEFLATAFRDWCNLTPKQVEVAKRIMGENQGRIQERAIQENERRSNAAPWVAGRQTIEGVIVSVKRVENDFGGADKALYKLDDGRLLWATIPSVLGGTLDEMKGKRVRMAVTVAPKESDLTFAFGSRPAKAEIIETPEAV
jgi:hypothetical protein